MKRSGGLLLLLTGLVGCVSTSAEIGTPGANPGGGGAYMSHAFQNNGGVEGAHNGASVAMIAPGLTGPCGTPVPVTAPAVLHEPNGADLARSMLAQGLPPEMLLQAGFQPGIGGNSGIIQAQGACPPGGCPPGGVPPMGMPGTPPMMTGLRPPGAVAAVGAITPGSVSPFPVQRTSVRFVAPSGMKISWFAPREDGKPGFGTEFLTAPGSYNFPQAAIYRLKLTDLPNRAGVELYPTLEVVPANAKTCTFLAHSTVPVTFTEEDLEQVSAGNYVVKVIYLPDPQYQDLAGGAEEVVSSRLEPGVDPIAEACRRGSILLVVRVGNINLELAHSPPVDAPSPWARQMAPPMPPMGMAGMPGALPGMPGMQGMPGMPGMNRPNAPTSPVNAPPWMMGQPGMPNQLPNLSPPMPGSDGTPVGMGKPGPTLDQAKFTPPTTAQLAGRN